MLRAIKIRLYPNKTQEEYIGKLLGSYRYVYNTCVNRKIESYKKNKTSENLSTLGKYFHGELLKDEKLKWLKEHNTKVLKQSIINMLQAYNNFFKSSSGYPRFKSKHDSKLSCRFPKEAISKRNDYSTNKLTLTSNIKNIKFKCSDKYKNFLVKHKDGIKSATLSKTKSGKYFLSILVETENTKNLPKTTNSIGIDLGLKGFVITSEGETFDNIKIKRNNHKKLAKLHRELSRKKKGSNNRSKARIKLAKLYEKLNNKKENYLHHVANSLLNENQVIAMEDLDVSGMMKNPYLAKSIQELSLHRFKTIFKYKAEWYGRDILEIDRYFPSSKNCNNCGNKKSDLKLSDRTYKCVSCGYENDRDLNAALNILSEGKNVRNKNRRCDGDSSGTKNSSSVETKAALQPAIEETLVSCH